MHRGPFESKALRPGAGVIVLPGENEAELPGDQGEYAQT